MSTPHLQLTGFTFKELFTPAGLQRLDEAFAETLRHHDKRLYEHLLNYRSGAEWTMAEISAWIIECAPIVEAFIADLFNIQQPVAILRTATCSHDPIFAFKKYYVLREARRALKKSEQVAPFHKLNQWLSSCLISAELNDRDHQLGVATLGQRWLAEPTINQRNIAQLVQWCVAAMAQAEGQQVVKHWESFRLPAQLNYADLVATVPVTDDQCGRLQGPVERQRYRDGFHLTDQRMSERQVLDEIHYCVYCHKNSGDFCSKGFPHKKGRPDQGFKINPLDEILTGCPLDEKISEMHVLKKNGFSIAALATVMIDNPLCPATGHRICNDCMKACIYQKQDPVNIPQTETRILTDVLALPWGVEIYDLLTRWNPLRRTQFRIKPYNGKKVLIMGMGPAGFTLAHYLLMEGCAVVGAEGLKIEPLPQELIKQPIYRYADLTESLDDRIMAGFGGVAEYGITVRWDKNFLKLIYITLLRRQYFQVFGGIRFGGTLKVEDAWQLGFDHLSVAVGAGLPKELSIAHSLAPGMRQANDFLMALQLTGAAKPSSLANLQVRMPAIVIGGGLTCIDTATEVQVYYIVQVEKISQRYQILVRHFGEHVVRSRFDCVSLEILDEFLMHGEQVRYERELAQQQRRQPNFIKLLHAWGGVTVVYRRTMQESPAYKRNHEEVIKALEEGIYYAEGLEPIAVKLDEHGLTAALLCHVRVVDEEGAWVTTDKQQILQARAIFVATGARPNIAYEYEHRGTFAREGYNYARFTSVDDKLQPVYENTHCKIEDFGAFTSYQVDDHRVTFLGDTHPVFHGSVVKAIASAKRIYPQIVASLSREGEYSMGNVKEYEEFHVRMAMMFQARVVAVKRCSSDQVELTVKAPMQARNFYAGQFFRLQNYESLAPLVGNTRLQTETLAMLGMRDEFEPDNLSFMVVERGVSSRLVATFQPDQPISLMGPTGCHSKIPTGESKTIMIVGGSMAAVYTRSLGPSLRAHGHRVFYVSCMHSCTQLLYQQELEAATDAILWLTTTKDWVAPGRPQDIAVQGELITALRDYVAGVMPQFTKPPFVLSDVDQVIVVGSHDMLARVKHARESVLKDYFSPQTEFIASVYGPMQCMLKGVCAQCLQWQIDPITGERTKAVYACSWQHQPLEKIDIANIAERLQQNRTQECLTDLWLDYLFETEVINKV